MEIMRAKKYAIGLVNFTLRDGLFWELDIPQSAKEDVALDMTAILINYFYDYFKTNDIIMPFGRSLDLLKKRGRHWNMYNTKVIQEHFKSNYCTDKKITFTEVTEKGKKHIQNFLRMIVHYCFRGELIEQIHNDYACFTQDHMKAINVDVMNRMGLFWQEHLCHNEELADYIIQVYYDKFSQ